MLARQLQAVLGPAAVRVDHTGSTSVPGLAAKDCIDIQVRVHTLDEDSIVAAFERIGFRVRPEPWNRTESASGVKWPKLVFAPPVGEWRQCNIHVRESASATARRNLLFRDFLRANDTARDAWGDFKQRLALIASDIYQYGQTKAGPTEILMMAAESWASSTGWTTP
jgi:dephospho-CoA kinase